MTQRSTPRASEAATLLPGFICFSVVLPILVHVVPTALCVEGSRRGLASLISRGLVSKWPPALILILLPPTVPLLLAVVVLLLEAVRISRWTPNPRPWSPSRRFCCHAWTWWRGLARSGKGGNLWCR